MGGGILQITIVRSCFKISTSRSGGAIEVEEADSVASEGLVDKMASRFQDWRNRPRQDLSPEQVKVRRIIIAVAVETEQCC